jgi:hypothetical protein
MAKKQQKLTFGMPGMYAQARNQAGGDWAAGLLLYRINWRWSTVKKKLHRLGKEWIAMSRSQWAIEAGLSESEMKNKALPKLRKRPFLEIRQMKLGDKKVLWVHLDQEMMEEYTQDWEDWYLPILNGESEPVGHEPDPAYPYKPKPDDWD